MYLAYVYSWIDIQPEDNVQQQQPHNSPQRLPGSFSDKHISSSVQNLLLEAQHESRVGSVKDSNSVRSSSPKSPKSPPPTDHANRKFNDWMMNWASRVEAEPPKEWKLIHPCNKSDPAKFDEDNDDENEMRKEIIGKKSYRLIVLTNACSFILGMGIMYLCLRRYLRLKTPCFYALE
ncbi:unnamed protein product [Didymodactylos carnosus]|uniref:Uncharacterized protein n=1 Tax=Didymodactylos carnosus TaxID=1234261 RepID=A0A813U9Z6_9BILA|nr:unnamed protein product [Didymodactylos carnosus]CAF1518189.1 unnamed protein product [Didymodactylos carnosus]CAF3611437.1 unnamed protein product [Didymodactylos carnosus]CAF4305578.1 unnamed protein product [Didymodactylos carnosus]